MNKRQALIGWLVYKAGKPIAMKVIRRKATPPMPEKRSKVVPAAAIAAGAGAIAGAVLFWRHKSDDEGPSPS